MLSHRRDLGYLILAILVVILGLFNSGLDDNLANQNPPPHVSALRRPLVQASYHFRQHTNEGSINALARWPLDVSMTDAF